MKGPLDIVLLFGRVTYEGMAAYWTTAKGDIAVFAEGGFSRCGSTSSTFSRLSTGRVEVERLSRVYVERSGYR